jgi:hypothetical protein
MLKPPKHPKLVYLISLMVLIILAYIARLQFTLILVPFREILMKLYILVNILNSY